ncbi:putative 90s preribosome component rrp12 [Diplodia seriata]|uniref:Putative 90s preribosome component rrp12 n=1 Tax=Diplodia seriata TaxID=420778 RepID=A0A0G2EI24_9PEZI|nr:putative 90s preribosome component rrp12 [Diplodia seriata]
MGDANLKVGQLIELNDGRIGVIRFIGDTAFADGLWVGVEFDDASGKNDGSVQGLRTSASPSAPVAQRSVSAVQKDAEIKELQTKLRVLEEKRAEDREKIATLDRVQEERNKYEQIIQKLQAKIQPLSLENNELKKNSKEAELRLEQVEAIQAEHESILEMATLDREMAEEQTEAYKADLEAVKQRLEELELENEILKDENQELGQDMNPEERTSMGWLQLERENERLREALLRLRDITQESESELRDQLKSLEEDNQELSGVKEQCDETKTKLLEAEADIEDLRQQLDAALGAEEMIEELTDKNLALNEYIEQLKVSIEELETLKELNDELEVNHVENEKQLQEQIDYKDSIIADLGRRAMQQDETLSDQEYTILRFRELVTNLQSDMEDMRASREISETQAQDLNNRSRAMMDLNRQLQASASSTKMKTIDMELRKLEAQEAAEHLAIVQLFLPEAFHSERESVLALLRFKRIGFKASLVHSFVKDKVSGDAPINDEDIFEACDVLDKLTWISAMCDRFVTAISTCSLDQFARFEGTLYELEPVERALNGHIDGLKRDELKEKQVAEELHRSIAVMSHLAETHLGDGLEGYANDIVMRTLLMQSHLETTAAALMLVKGEVQTRVPSHGEDDYDGVDRFISKTEEIIAQSRSAKVIVGKSLRTLQELKARSLTLQNDTLNSFEECQDASDDLAHYVRKMGENVFQLLHEDSRTEPFAISEVRSAMFRASEEVFSVSESEMYATFSARLRKLGEDLTELVNITSDLELTVEFEKHPAPWVLRSKELQDSKIVSVDTEEEIRRLKEEVHARSMQIKLQEQKHEEAAVKIELLESRTRDSSKKAQRITELEKKLEENKSREKQLAEALETQVRDLAGLETEKEKWKAQAEQAKAIEAAMGGEGKHDSGGEKTVATKREIDALKTDIQYLEAANRYLRQSNRREHIGKVAANTSWLRTTLVPPSKIAASAADGGAQNADAMPRRRLAALQEITNLPAVSKLVNLKDTGDAEEESGVENAAENTRPRNSKLRWRPMKSTPQWQLSELELRRAEAWEALWGGKGMGGIYEDGGLDTPWSSKMSLNERLDKIRSSPKLQNQQQTAVVLSAVEDTLRDQKSDFTPTAYFAALLSLLAQYISPQKGIVNKEVATAVVYLLDLVAPDVPAPLLRAKFSQILTNLAPALTHPEAEAPLLRSSIGCLEGLLVVQDAQAWALPQTQISPRRAVAGLLTIATDHRPKVRKRAQDALAKVLKNPPPSPSLDHPAADMCAETALRSLKDITDAVAKNKKHHRAQKDGQSHEPGLIHALQLIKVIASAAGGWPSKKIDALCELLLNISKSSNEFLTMAAFEVFEAIFAGMVDEMSSAKLPRLLEVIGELQPSQNDSQLLPPWIAVLSRGYDVAAQVEPEETFQKLPDLFSMMSNFLASASHNIRISASEGLISFVANCIPDSVLLEPSIFDEKVLEKLAKNAAHLLSVKYQAAWMEVFNVVGAMFDAFRWRAAPIMSNVVKTVGDLRGNESFTGKKEADEVLGKAIRAMGPDNVLEILPLNLHKPIAGQPGRAWLLPIIRDSVANTRLAHFRAEMVPLSEAMFQRVLNHGSGEKTMEIKIFETIVNQTWATLPGYCDLPTDLHEAFDQSFAEMIANLLYQQVELRNDLCRALQNLVESNKAIAEVEGEEDLVAQSRVSKADAQKNLEYLSGFASNILAVLFNVYNQTLPQSRGNILSCINAYLSVTPTAELMETFTRVASMLEQSLTETGPQTQADKQKDKKPVDKMPPASHTLMDLVITISIYLPRESFVTLFQIATLMINKDDDPQLQKKAYKLIPRLGESDLGKAALQERNAELQKLLLDSAPKATSPAKRDRLAALSQVVEYLPSDDLHFIPAVLSEVVIACKEVNEKARTAAFDLLVFMGVRMKQGGTVVQSKIPLMDESAPSVPATLEEYITMMSAGLAGSTPHMISASITGLTRILYEFRTSLPDTVITDLVQTMDLFLTSANREMVRSVLGFVKVSVISLPSTLMLPRLNTLIPNLLVWSHEHKGHFKAKVKHIFERMIRRFGVEVVEKNTPESDRKLITNIRKTHDRQKRKKAAADAGEGEENHQPEKRRSKFESEYDEAVYGSESESDAGSDVSDDETMGRKGGKKGGKSYIIEDEDEPLDLLDRRALGNVSSTKPLKGGRAGQQPQRTKAKTDLDGKLLLGDSSDDDDGDDMMLDGGDNPGDGSLEGGINAYVSAIRGQDTGARKGRGGKIKFSNKKNGGDGDEMEVDQEEVAEKLKSKQPDLEYIVGLRIC